MQTSPHGHTGLVGHSLAHPRLGFLSSGAQAPAPSAHTELGGGGRAAEPLPGKGPGDVHKETGCLQTHAITAGPDRSGDTERNCSTHTARALESHVLATSCLLWAPRSGSFEGEAGALEWGFQIMEHFTMLHASEGCRDL